MTMHSSPMGKLRGIVIVLCLAVILGIFGYAYVNDVKNSVADKDVIIENVESLEKNPSYHYVSTYIKRECGIGNIYESKVNSIESILETEFYTELPDEMEIAKTTSLLFLEYFYDNIDLEDKDAVTDAVLKCMLASIGDPYAYYRTAEEFDEYLADIAGGGEFVGIGIMIDRNTLVIGTVFNGSGADEAGIKRGDKLHGVGDKTVNDTDNETLLNMIAGEENSTVEITVERGGELYTYTVTRKLIANVSVTYNMEMDSIGYIQITQFVAATPEEFATAVDALTEAGAKALIIDVRNNPGGLLNSVVDVIDYIVPDAEDRMIASYTHSGGEYVYYTTDEHSVDLPIAVLCNGGTASAGELFTGAMRDYGNEGILETVIIGDTTYGKGVAQTSYTLSDGSGITFTIGYFNPPSDVNFNGVGVIPDITVEDNYESDIHVSVAIGELTEMLMNSEAELISLLAA